VYYVHVNSIKNIVKKLKIKIKKWRKNRNWITFYVQRKKIDLFRYGYFRN